MRCPALMNRAANGNNRTIADRPQVICIDFKAQCDEFHGINGHPTGDGSNAFCKNTIGPTVHDAQGLPHALRHWHSGFKKIRTHFDNFNSQDAVHIGLTGRSR